MDRTFRRVFHEAYGSSPRDMRKQARASDPRPSGPTEGGPRDREVEVYDTQPLAPHATAARQRLRTALGLCDRRRASELRLRLRRRYPRLDDDARRADAAAQRPPAQRPPALERHPVVLPATGDFLEDIAAAAVLGQFIDGPEAELRFALLHGVVFGNVGGYLHLQRICTGMIEWDADRAVVLAELAVQMIGPHRKLMADEGDDWQALAWTFLARVQVLVGDCGGAEQSLGFVQAEVGDPNPWTPWVEIELRQVEGMVRKRQRRYDEAERALDRAVELGRELPSSHPNRWQTVLQRLELASACGDVESGLALCGELEELVEGHDAGGEHLTLWRGFVSFHRAKAHAYGGCAGRAEQLLRQTMSTITADPACDTDPRLGLLFTFVLYDLARIAYYNADHLGECEKMLRLALERFRWLEIPVFAAASEAELAVVCALRGQRAEARQRAAAAASFLDDLPFHREAWNAAGKLRALADDGADAPADELMDVLEALRGDLDLVAWEIAGSQAIPAAKARRAVE